MALRIGICGSAGSGKTGLAEALSVEYKVPLLRSREITEDILRRDGYDFSSGIQIERFLANSGRQNEILRRTLEQQREAPDFVTDRTVVDLAAYVMCEMHDMDVMAVSRLMETCKKSVSGYTHLVVCPWKNAPVEDNRRRTLNPWYQFLIHLVEMGLVMEWGCEAIILKSHGTEERVREIKAILTKV